MQRVARDATQFVHALRGEPRGTAREKKLAPGANFSCMGGSQPYIPPRPREKKSGQSGGRVIPVRRFLL